MVGFVLEYFSVLLDTKVYPGSFSKINICVSLICVRNVLESLYVVLDFNAHTGLFSKIERNYQFNLC